MPCIRLLEKFWYESVSHIHFGEWDPVHVQRALDQHLTNGFVVGWASFAHGSEMNSVLLAIRDKCFWKDIELLRETSDKKERNRIDRRIKSYKSKQKSFHKNQGKLK